MRTYNATRELLEIVNPSEFKDELHRLTWLGEMPIALIILPLVVFLETLCLPYVLFSGEVDE